MTPGYEIIGAVPSPYSVKLRAIMRYRRLPHVWRLRHADMQAELAPIRPPVMPYLRYPDGAIRNDTTPLAYDLEARHAERSILPPDRGLAFLAHLIEDFADEWGTRIMAFHRWNHAEDQAFVSRWAGSEMLYGRPRAEQDQMAADFRARQTGRLDTLGAHPDNREVLARTYRAVLTEMRAIAHKPGFLFGTRPALADFGWFGQLYQCAMDPTAGAIMRGAFQDVFAWVLRLDDASGIDGKWCEDIADLPPPTKAMLALAGAYYLPFLAANAVAHEAGEDIMEVALQGAHFRQKVSVYEVKCLGWLREEWAALTPQERAKITPLMTETSCIAYFASATAGAS